ncbi:MAG: anti-sigma factor [Acidobacteria bacterium]|nr:anti-sigma factor [Acidobacteriota bacterium]
MSCQTVQKSISAYLDGTLAGEDRNFVMRHLARCRECEARWEGVRHVHTLLRDLPVAAPPPELASRLKVVASHERARRLARINFVTRVRTSYQTLKLFTDNLMRPLALPAAGGVVSAMLLFGMLMPTLLFQFNFHNDVPTPLSYTQASLREMAPFTFSDDDEILVEVTVNERGEITDYDFPGGRGDRKLDSGIANILLFSRFNPVTLFGQPTSGKLLISFQRSHFVVRG